MMSNSHVLLCSKYGVAMVGAVLVCAGTSATAQTPRTRPGPATIPSSNSLAAAAFKSMEADVEKLKAAQQDTEAARKEMTASIRSSDPLQKQRAIEVFNQRMKLVEQLTEQLIAAYPDQTSEIAEVCGDSFLLRANAYARAAELYYIALISGNTSEGLSLKLARAYDLMVSNAQFADPTLGGLQARFVLPARQDTITNADIQSWKGLRAALRASKSIADLINSTDPHVKYGLKVLAESVIASRSADSLTSVQPVSKTSNGPLATTSPSAREIDTADGVLQRESIQSALKSLETSPNSAEKIEGVIYQLKGSQKKIREKYTSIPNLDRLRAASLPPEEPEVIDLFYQYAIVKDYAGVIQSTTKLKSGENDPRVQRIKACAAKELGNWTEARSSLDRLLQLEPKNFWARHALLSLEEMEGRAASPQTRPLPSDGVK